jgi:hypothetical protein
VAESGAGTVLVRPRASLARTGLIAMAIGGLPLFGVLYWMSALQGSWRRVLVVHIIVIVIAGLAWIRHSNAYAEVTETRVIKQAFFGFDSVDRSSVASAVIAQTWRPGSSEAVPQLLLLDADGNRLIRFRGTFWSLESMEEVVSALGVTVTFEKEPVSLREFFEAHPTAAYWYEGKPWVAAVGIVVAFASAFAIMSWIMIAIGAPSALTFGR